MEGFTMDGLIKRSKKLLPIPFENFSPIKRLKMLEGETETPKNGMDSKTYIEASAEMTSFIVNYLENIRDRRVLPQVEPGYMRYLLPEFAPDEPEKWEDVMKDIELVIMPGVTHWHSPRFNAYFPTANSYPALLADMLCGAIGCIGFSWIASPACTELEMVMMDWLGELIGLPSDFLYKNNSGGGGVIQGTASEATLMALLAAKVKRLEELKRTSETTNESHLSSKLVAYASVERGGRLAGVILRLLPHDSDFSLRGETLRQAILEDKEKGLSPFCVVATLGTTNSCSFDNLQELGEVAKEEGLWIHVDAAYAGAAFICEEFRYLMKGIEMVNSFNFNPHKWLLVNFDCSAMWVKNSMDIVNSFNVDPLYLKHAHQGEVPDYRHWQIPLGRRFRSLKLWFVMRLYGRIGLQEHIRKQISLAKMFEDYMKQDSRLEIISPVTLGLVCFRLKGSNKDNEVLLQSITENGFIYIVPAKIDHVFFLRFAICSRFTESKDVFSAWKEIQKNVDYLTIPED